MNLAAGEKHASGVRAWRAVTPALAEDCNLKLRRDDLSVKYSPKLVYELSVDLERAGANPAKGR